MQGLKLSTSGLQKTTTKGDKTLDHEAGCATMLIQSKGVVP
ncbi:hypothetical protein VCHA53O466_140152 [Vibrio chagasii]|nr:hypothetical protein VCHA53O466_140152 [Vibrio chagasii]